MIYHSLNIFKGCDLRTYIQINQMTPFFFVLTSINSDDLDIPYRTIIYMVLWHAV